MTDVEQLRYPIGKAPRVAELDAATRTRMIDSIADSPARYRSLVAGLSDAQLDTPYRPGGWTIRQVVHHVPDSHMNAYIRTKLALTEDTPAIRTYLEDRWAELPVAKSGPVEMSLALLAALHQRWVTFLRALPNADFARTFNHPDWGPVTIDGAIALYEWHCRHHAAHIEQALAVSA